MATLQRRLATASGLVSVALLVGGTNAALAFAHPHTGSGNGGSGSSSSSGSSGGSSGSGGSSSGRGGPSSNHSGSSSGGPSSSHSGTNSGSNSGSNSSQHGSGSTGTNSGSGSSNSSSSGSSSSGSSSSSSSSGSSSSSSSSSDDNSSSSGGPTSSNTRPQNPLAGLTGQLSRAAKQAAGALTGDSSGDDATDDSTTKGSKSGHSGKTKHTRKTPTAGTSGTTPGTGNTATGTTPNDTAATTGTTTKQTPATTSLPQLAAQVPLTALDFIKTGTTAIAAAIPLPGISALPAIADAIITPLEKAVNGLASAASGLPFMQIDLTQVGTAEPSQMITNRYQRSGPSSSTGPKSAGPDPLTRGSGAAEAPVLPPKAPEDQGKRDHVFSASNHFDKGQEFRPGYPDYLRAAGMSEVAAVAVPGFAGIITLTAAGGLLGYRQARAGRATAPSRAARFVS